MPADAVTEQLEAQLAEVGKKELALQQLIKALPGEIRRHDAAGDHITADRLEADLHEARTLMTVIRKQITLIEGKLYSRRR